MRLLFALLAGLLVAAGPVPGPPADPGTCTCAVARVKNGWCAACDVGYVASIEIRCRYLFNALDAHGHRIDPAGMRCDACTEAHATGAYCQRHHVGFVGELAYFSRLNYELARGRITDVAALSCTVCKANARRHLRKPRRAGDDEGPDAAPKSKPKPSGWCDACGVGMIGNVAIADRKRFEVADRELQRLLAAIETSRRCEHCAAALFYDTQCPVCRIRYKDGKPVEPEPEPAEPAPPDPPAAPDPAG